MHQQEETSFNEKESLRLIGSMISTARNQMCDNGHLYLLWGWVILACSAGHYIMKQVFSVDYFWTIWLLTPAAMVYQTIYLIRHQKTKLVRTYMDDILRNVWLVFSILMILMTVVMTRVVKNPDQINLAILVLYGMPTFLSGTILKFRPLILGGIGCWVLSLLAFFMAPQYYMLLISAGVIIAWIIPGYLLQMKYKKQNIAI